MGSIRLLNANNTTIGESKPSKLDLRPGSFQFTYWQMPVPPTSGVYLAEVLLDGRVMWREAFRVTR